MAKESFPGSNTTTSGSDPIERSEFSFDLSKPKAENVPAAATETSAEGALEKPAETPVADLSAEKPVPVSPELEQVRQKYSFFEEGLVEARGIKDPDKRMAAIANSLAVLDELRQKRGLLDGTIKPFDGFRQDQEVRYQLPDGKIAVARMVAKQDHHFDSKTGLRIDDPSDPLIFLETFDRSKPDPADWVPVRVAMLASKLREAGAVPQAEIVPEKPTEKKAEAPRENRYEQEVRSSKEAYDAALKEYERDLFERVRAKFLISPEFDELENSVLAKVKLLQEAGRGEKLTGPDEVAANLVLLKRFPGRLTPKQREKFESDLARIIDKSGALLAVKESELAKGRATFAESVPGQGGVYENLANRKLVILLDAERKLNEAVDRRNAETEAQRVRGKFRVVAKDGDSEAPEGDRSSSQAL